MWKDIIETQKGLPYFKDLGKFLQIEYATKTIYPPKDQMYQALKLTSYDATNVVILGQDPYIQPKQAHGLSFSIADNSAKFPPSLRNMFQELAADLGVSRTNSNLTDWAKQGVLLLNTVLTVEAGKSGSHRKKGWEQFSDAILQALNEKEQPVIFVLWGNDARSKKALITQPQHRIIEGVHPSPLSAYRGFFGSRPFSTINKYLQQAGLPEIKWSDE